ncbi:MAG: hypothetical protein IIA72_01745 [Proteobacteria bacterium]|nr:hypothetical protein [Pseudomonadota bacterium]
MNRRAGIVRIVTLLVIVCVLALPLGACGKKASPEPPPGKQSEFPRQYPRR